MRTDGGCAIASFPHGHRLCLPLIQTSDNDTQARPGSRMRGANASSSSFNLPMTYACAAQHSGRALRIMNR